MSFGTSAICGLCSTQPSVTLCEGCQGKFCHICFNKHRNELSLELDDLFNRRNELMEILNNHSSNNSTNHCPCFNEINQWQKEMHANIDRIASETRNNIQQIILESSKNVRNELDQISQDLQQRQKTNGYVEGDLNRIKQQLIKLNLTIQQFNEQIRIDTSSSKNLNWNSLLFIIPNKENHMHTTPIVAASSPILYSSFNRNSNNSMTMPHSQLYSNNSMTVPHSQLYSYAASPTTTLYPTNMHPPAGRNTSGSMGSRPLTYTCIGCKTRNNLNENGRNYCSVCRAPAPF